MPDHYLLTATEAKFVTNKPHTLIIVCGTQRYECLIKISEAKIKRRSNDTQVIESHSLSSDVSLSITSTSWMYSVRTKGGKTAGRPPQQYMQMKRMGVYRITSVYDVTSVSLRVADVTYELPHWTPEEHTQRMASLPTSPTSRSRAVMPREQYLHECKETTPIRRVAEGELPHQPRNKKMKVETTVKVEEKMEHVMIPTSSTWIPPSEHESPVSTASTPTTSELIESTPMSYGLDFQLASVSQAPDQLWYTVPSSHIHGLLSPHYPNQQPLFSDEVDVDGYGSMLDGWKPSEQVDDFVGSLFAPLSPHEDMGMEVQDMTSGLQVDISPQSVVSPSPSSTPTSPGISQPPVTRSFSSLSFSSDSDLSLEEQLDQRLDELVDSVVGTGDMADIGMGLLDQIQVQDMQPQAYVFQAQQQPVQLQTPPQVQVQASQEQETFVFYPAIQPVMQPQFAAQSYQEQQNQQQTLVQSFSPGPSLIQQQQVQVQASRGTGQQQHQQQIQAQISPGTGQISPGIQQQQQQQQIQVRISPGIQQEQQPISPGTQHSPGTGTQQQQVQMQVHVSPGTGQAQQYVQVYASPGTGQEQQQQVQVQVQASPGTGTGSGIGMVFQQQLAISPTLQTAPSPFISVSSGGGSPLDGLQIGLGADTSQHVIREVGASVPTSNSSQSQQIPLHDHPVTQHAGLQSQQQVTTPDTSQLQSGNQHVVHVDSSHVVTQQVTTADASQLQQVTTHDTSQSQVSTSVTTQSSHVSAISADIGMQRVSIADTSVRSISSSDGSNVSQHIPRTSVRASTAQQFMSTMLALSILPNILNLGTRDDTSDDNGNQHSRMVHSSTNDHDDQHSRTMVRDTATDVDVATHPYASDGTHVMMETSQRGYQQRNRTDTNVVSSQSQSQSEAQSMSQFQSQSQQAQPHTQANGGNYQHVRTMVSPSLESNTGVVIQTQQFTQQQSQIQDSIQQSMVSQRSSQVQDIQQFTQATRSSQSSQVYDIQQSTQAARLESQVRNIQQAIPMASLSRSSQAHQRASDESMVGIIQDVKYIQTIVCMIHVWWMTCLVYIACWITYLHNMLFFHLMLQVSQSMAMSQPQNQSPGLAVTALISPLTISQQAQVQAQTSVSQHSQVQAQNGLEESIISGVGSGVAAVSGTSLPMLQDTALSAQGRTPAMIMLSPLSLSSPLVSQVQGQTGSQVMLSTSVVDTVFSSTVLASPSSASAVLASPSLPMFQTDVSSQDIVLQSLSQATSSSQPQGSNSTISHQKSSQSQAPSQLSHASSIQASTTQVDTSLSSSSASASSALLVTPLSLSTSLVDASSIPVTTEAQVSSQLIESHQHIMMMVFMMITSICMMGYKQIKQDQDEQLLFIHETAVDSQQQSSVEIQPQPSTHTHDGSDPHLPRTDLQSIPSKAQVSNDESVILMSHVISSVMMMITYVISNTWQQSSQQSSIHEMNDLYPSCPSVNISMSSHSTAISSHTTSSSQMPSASITTGIIDAICMLMSLCVNLDTSLPFTSSFNSSHQQPKSCFNSSHQHSLFFSYPSCDRILVSHPVVVAA